VGGLGFGQGYFGQYSPEVIVVDHVDVGGVSIALSDAALTLLTVGDAAVTELSISDTRIGTINGSDMLLVTP
jgi:hypothetical protein